MDGRTIFSLMLGALTLTAAAPNPRLAGALADPGRAAFRANDARRHPAELVALADLQPGQRVLDLIPGDGYWTRIFSKMVGPKGRVYAMWPQAYAKDATGNVQQLRDLARTYPNVSTLVEPTAILTAPEPLDVVWTSDNFHDYNDKFMGNPGPAVLAKICLQGAQARWPPNRHRPRGGDRPRPA
jgi:predicted methyltransferase